MKPITKHSATYLLLLLAILLPDAVEAQWWGRFSRFLPVISSCKAESNSQNRGYNYSRPLDFQLLNKEYESIRDEILVRYANDIEEYTEISNAQIEKQVETDIREFISHFHFKDAYSTLSGQILTNSKYETLTQLESATLRIYTSSDGFLINKAIRTGDFSSELGNINTRGMKYLMDQAFDKAPKWEGDVVFRGMSSSEADLTKDWQVGNIIVFEAYTSTSTEFSIAEEYMNNAERKFYKIFEAKGIDMTDFSYTTAQEEILLSSRSNFEVTGFSEELDSQGRLNRFVLLKYLGSDEPIPAFKLEYDATGTLESTPPGMSPMGTSVSPESLLKMVSK